ncbi:MAG: hypothetical protein KF893_09180 [Caldilineaceae bacterium]|nr:hypothetical protein [Caldilineaceae bacterium]
MTLEHDWLIPSPFWSANGYRQVEFFRPALFEFHSDDFMEEFLAAAASPKLTGLQTARLQPSAGNQPSKLFQPVHGCFYLAAASLCCRQPGFPDRQVRRNEGERAAFVLRKLVDGKEYAWVVEDEQPGWKPLNGAGRALLTGEEQLPVFPVPLADGRQLFCGYIPAASSETYKVPPGELAVDGEDLDAPIQELGSRFTSPLTREPLPDNNPPGNFSLVDRLPDDVAWTTSVYLLVELWEFLQTYLKDATEAIAALPASANFHGDKAGEKRALLSFLQTQAYKGSLSLAEALQTVAQNYEALNAPGGGDLDALGLSQDDYSLRGNHDLSNTALQTLLDRVAAALPDERPPVAVPKLDVSTSVRYVLRFVYERPQCEPTIVEVSQPSQPFTFAPFFDPDAPARPIRIPLPSDVSIAGMRKFKKNVTFMMSDAMRKKMNQVLGREESLLSDDPKVNAEDSGAAFAFICSFSIQIIFIIAFMLLLIFAFVFNIIFWWMAFFRICLPVPKSLLPE